MHRPPSGDVSHFVVPAEQWPRGKVYCLCPGCAAVHGVASGKPVACPGCGQGQLQDVFSEMADRLRHAWRFFEATRADDDWLFRHSPESSGYSLWSSICAMSAYGELRAMGFVPPWDDDEILCAWAEAMERHLDPDTNLLNGPHGEEVPAGLLIPQGDP